MVHFWASHGYFCVCASTATRSDRKRRIALHHFVHSRGATAHRGNQHSPMNCLSIPQKSHRWLMESANRHRRWSNKETAVGNGLFVLDWLRQGPTTTWLVGGWQNPSEKYEFVSWDEYNIINIWRRKKRFPNHQPNGDSCKTVWRFQGCKRM